MNDKDSIFPGFDVLAANDTQTISDALPIRLAIIDVPGFTAVDLDQMTLRGDAGTTTLKLRAKTKALTGPTAFLAQFAILTALDGKRKLSTVAKWLNEFSTFARSTVELLGRNQQVSTITLGMFSVYCAGKGASQQKLLRSFIKFWYELKIPGIASDLQWYIETSKAPKADGPIAVQNRNPQERPFSFAQSRAMVHRVDDLYLSKTFSLQDYTIWRLNISEALRPSQMQLLQYGDVKIRWHEGRILSVELSVPMVKQTGTAARTQLLPTKLSESIGDIVAQQVAVLERLSQGTVNAKQPLFSVVSRVHSNTSTEMLQENSILISNFMSRTRDLVTENNASIADEDVFMRRLKHTKLTQLAAKGASQEVLLRAAFHSTPGSTSRYVNITDDAFEAYEVLMRPHHEAIKSSFRGEVLARVKSTKPDEAHRIFTADLADDVGGCSAELCGILAPDGCYICPRFEAFTEGNHDAVYKNLTAKKAFRSRQGLSPDVVSRDDHLIEAVSHVISVIRNRKDGT